MLNSDTVASCKSIDNWLLCHALDEQTCGLRVDRCVCVCRCVQFLCNAQQQKVIIFKSHVVKCTCFQLISIVHPFDCIYLMILLTWLTWIVLYVIVLNIHPSTNVSSSRQIDRHRWIDIRNKMGWPMVRTEVEYRDLNFVLIVCG